jgi:hypothetical protein
MNQNGQVHGEKEDQDGILNAQLWQVPYWVKQLTYMLVVLIYFSLIMTTPWHRLKHVLTVINGSIISFILVIFTLIN